ncbi:hypothetical protein [Bradyrhizobium sp.]|uniref:hypothetical protein n=1 Tax=Bradyrhizobium sp. TaxID=376 RepID=UPI0007C91ADB|nr:hypothetical protein [Bradyrhizobium sp.]
MPSGDEEATAEREALLSGRWLVELVLFEFLLFALLLFEPLLELLVFVFIAPVVARAFLVGANVYPTLFRKWRRATTSPPVELRR